MKKLFWIMPIVMLTSCGVMAKTVDRILAQVNDDIITLSDLKREMTLIRQDLATKYTGEQLEQAVKESEKAALDSLIREKLLYQKAMELGYGSNVDARISSTVQMIMKENNFKGSDELDAALAQQGTNLRDFREQIRKRIVTQDLVSDFVASRITLLTSEIEKYYRDHAAQFSVPEEVSLSEIVIPSESDPSGAEAKVGEIYQRLRQGESFATLASQYSKGPTASKGGSIGSYVTSKLNPEVVGAIEEVNESDISAPQKIQGGYVIYRVDKRRPATIRPLEEVRDEIRNRMWEAKFNPELERFVAQLREDAYIQIFSEK